MCLCVDDARARVCVCVCLCVHGAWVWMERMCVGVDDACVGGACMTVRVWVCARSLYANDVQSHGSEFANVFVIFFSVCRHVCMSFTTTPTREHNCILFGSHMCTHHHL